MKRLISSVRLSVIGVLLAMPLYAAAEEVMVGSIPGELSATPTGGAVYSIPIDCPQGVGVQPALSLTYNSQSGKGIVGWGWNLSGLSAIVRTPRTEYFDGKSDCIGWIDKDNPFSLNGQRLIVERSWGTDSVEYRLESDPTTMVRGYSIQSWGPSYLKAYTKEGLTMTYGDPQVFTSYIVPYEELLNNLATKFRMGWNLVEVTDANGNYMKLDYQGNFGTTSQTTLCESIIRKISYGGNKRKGSIGNIEILFEYESRPDVQDSYVSGKKFKQPLRLKTIKTKVSDEVQKEYRLLYDAASVVSRLQSVTLYDADNKKILDPLTFKYGQYNPDSKELSIPTTYKYNNGSGALKNKQGLIAVDLDGDGKSELGDVYYEMGDCDFGKIEYSYFDVRRKEDSWNTNKRFSLGYLNQYARSESYNIFTDLTCDGIPEKILLSMDGNMDMKLQVLNSMDNSIVSDPSTIVLFNSMELHSLNSPFVCAGNTKGSALGDVLVILDEPIELPRSYKYYYQLLSASENGKMSIDKYTGSFSVRSKIKKAFLVKLGETSYRDDLVLFMEDQTVRIIKNNGNSTNPFFYATNPLFYLPVPNDVPVRFGDMNGDGLTDVVYRENGNQWKIAYNRGSYNFDIVDLGTPGSMPCNASTGLKEPNLIKYKEKDDVFLLDINQDGLMDIVFADENLKLELPSHPSYSTYVFKETFWSFYLNTGNGFTKYLNEYSSEPSSYACFGDMLGKGDVNWVHAKAAGSMVITTFNFPRNPNLLTGIVNPVSGETTLEYKPHTECMHDKALFYNLQHYLTRKYMPFKSSQLKVFSGSNDGNTQFAYRYGHPFINWTCRGFMGFDSFEKKDVKKNQWELTMLNPLGRWEGYFLMLPTDKELYGEREKAPFLISHESYGNAIKSYTNFSGSATKRYAIRTARHKRTGNLAGESIVEKFYVYDDYNNLLESRTEALGETEVTKYTYQKQGAWCPGKLVRIEKNITCADDASSLLRISRFQYDARGNLVEERVDSGHVNTCVTRYKNYDEYGHPLRVEKEANGMVRSFLVSYTPSGRFVSSKTDPLGLTTSYVWDEKKGLLTKMTDHTGATSYAYDPFGQVTSITYPTGIVEKQSLEWVRDDPKFKYRTVQTRPDIPGKTIWTYYDRYGREVARDTYGSDLINRKVRTLREYNAKGKLYRISHPDYLGSNVRWAMSYSYDGLGRVIYKTTPEGNTSITYKFEGGNYVYEDSMEVKTPNGVITTTVWDLVGRKAEVITGGKSVRYTYTAGNRLKTAKPDGNNFIVQMEYDLQGNLTRQTDPDMGSIQYNYDGFGQLKWEKQYVRYSGNLVITEYEYVPGGLLRTKTRGSQITTYSYDAYQRLKTVTLSNGIHIRNLEYDAYDRPTKISDQIKGRSYVTQKSYDEYGRVKTETYPTGYAVTNSYDSYGYLKSVTDNSSRLIWRLDSCDAEGRVLKETKGSDATRYTYDTAGRVLSIQAPGIINSHYTYYTTGNLNTYTDSISKQAETYTYDTMDRLLTWKKSEEVSPYGTVTYDNAKANRIVLKYNSPWNSVLAGGYSYSYTSASNALKEVSYCTAPAQNITYNDFKKVTRLDQAGGSEYFNIDYGVDEERVYMKESHRYGVERYYVGNYAEEIGTSGSTTGIHYIYGGNGIAAVYKKSTGSSSGMLYSAYTDRQGSLVALVTGNRVVGRYAYDPWGNRRNPSNWLQKADVLGTLIVNRGYTMHEHLDAFGLINMNGRMYDPLSGTFLSPDPYIQSPGNWFNYNRYAYCMNNPLRYVDPSGEVWEFIVGGILIGAYIGASIEGGSPNPAKWSGCWWQGAIWGGLIGGATGGIIGAMWEAGASISIGFQAFGLKPITLISFSPASASVGGVATMSIGGGLGLGSGFTYSLGKKKDKNATSVSDYSSIAGMQDILGTAQREQTDNGEDDGESFRFPELDPIIQSGVGAADYFVYKYSTMKIGNYLGFLNAALDVAPTYNNFKDFRDDKISWPKFGYESAKTIVPYFIKPTALVIPVIEGYEWVWEQFKQQYQNIQNHLERMKYPSYYFYY